MVYYRVKKQFDGCNRTRGMQDGYYLVYGELFTKREIEHFNIDKKALERVNAKKCNSYWFFGGRFNSELQQDGSTHDERQRG